MAVRHSAVAKLPNLIRSLRKDSPKPLNHALPSLRRTFSLYDQINLINNVPEDQLRFRGYNDTGFTVNKVEYEGSLLCVGNLLLSWKPKKFSEITSDSLSVFQILRPIPELGPFAGKFLLEIGIKQKVYIQKSQEEMKRMRHS